MVFNESIEASTSTLAFVLTFKGISFNSPSSAPITSSLLATLPSHNMSIFFSIVSAVSSPKVSASILWAPSLSPEAVLATASIKIVLVSY